MYALVALVYLINYECVKCSVIKFRILTAAKRGGETASGMREYQMYFI
jgi:hypothetical protein